MRVYIRIHTYVDVSLLGKMATVINFWSPGALITLPQSKIQ